jgi:hypothetical protein
MKVFISWSGPQSNHIAQALRDWLRDVIQNLNPWMSEVDIGAGERWGERLWNELYDSKFGVVCLTAENLQSPWLHYEAGALAKAVDRRVCPYLYKIKPTMVQGPLSHHQMKQVDKQGTRELLHSINTASLTLTERGLPPEQLDKTFNTWWPQLEEKINAIPPSTTAPPPRREIQEIVEEILEIVRNQPRMLLPTAMGNLVTTDMERDNFRQDLDTQNEKMKREKALLLLKYASDLSSSRSDNPQDKKPPSK